MSLFVLRQARPTSSHFSVKRLTDAFFSSFKLYHVSPSWRKIQFTRLLLMCSLFTCVQAASSWGCLLLLLLFTVWPWQSVRNISACICFLAVGMCIRLVNVLWKRCKRSFYWTSAAPIQPARCFSCVIRKGTKKKAFGSICIMFWEMCPFIPLFYKIHFVSWYTHKKIDWEK